MCTAGAVRASVEDGAAYVLQVPLVQIPRVQVPPAQHGWAGLPQG